MKKEDFITDEFLKQFKSGDELTSFLKNIQKRGIEKMLEGELSISNQIIVMPVMDLILKR